MPWHRRISCLFGASALLCSGCFGRYAPADTDTEAGSAVSSSTAVSSTGSSSSTGDADVCEHLDILILTDVSVSMAPFAAGIVNVLLALGTRIEDTFGGVGGYRLALTYNVPPVVNEGAYSVPPEGEQCTQLGALVRGQDDCVEAFEGRPYLTDADDLGAGLSCLAAGLVGGQWDESYETPRTLDAIVSVLEAEGQPATAACNEGFHRSPDPLLIIVIVDSEDESEASVLEAVTDAVATQGTSLENVGIFVIGADASGCPDQDILENECGALPSCRVQEFIDRGFNNVSLGGNVRRFNICRSLEDDSAAVADDLLEQISAVVLNLCR